MDGLDGKVALITGGAKGIGAASARAFVASGARVMLADIDSGPSEALAGELGEAARFRVTDVTDDSQLDALVAAATEAFGGIDILVNGAVTFQDDGLGAAREAWLKSYNTNIVSPAHLLERAAPVMIARGGGAAVNFSSIAAKFGQRGRGPYPATKAAIRQLTRAQAMTYSRDNIRVNMISPSWTAETSPFTSLTDKSRGDAFAATYHPLPRMGTANDIAQAVLFLCSPAAGFITGADLPVDGGYHMTGPDKGDPVMGELMG